MKALFWGSIVVQSFVFISSPPVAQAQTKVGVLFITGGISVDYDLNWRVGFFDHLFAVWPYGFLAGGPKEGATCYTLIHYANDIESFICGVDEGTPIDAFCNEYTGTYPVHSLEDHWPADMGGDGTFFDNCYPNILPALVFNGHSTIDPETSEEINGPHIDDPLGSGIGIADFIESTAFGFMESLYYLPNNQNPSTRQDLKWFYGNDTPAFLGYPPDTPELTNIKDALIAAIPGTTFAFRHGSEAFMKNLDAYGNYAALADSTETALEELIHDEQVDRIVVINGAPDDSNLTSTGPCWRDKNGEGKSALPNKTYRQCLEDLTDGKGPATQAALDLYYEEKPWPELLKTVNPEVEHLVREIDPTMDVAFAPPLNTMIDFELSVLDMVNYAIAKYSIPDSASLRVILGAHGLSAGWRNVLQCDSYFRTVEAATNRLITRIQGSISRTGSFEVVGGGNEMSEAADDPVSVSKPFGNVWSSGERIEEAMNGTYVNELGQVVNNGTDKFDYIIVVLISFMSESTDTLEEARKGLLGNNILTSINGVPGYARDEHDADGSHYDAGDFDSEYFTVKVFDGTGWPSIPGCKEDPDCASHNPPVNKGVAAPDATTVILAGTTLALGNSTARTDLTSAAVQSIIEAINNPDVGGSGDLICEDIADGDGVPDASDNCPTHHNPGQEDNYPPGGNTCGDACECEGNFQGNDVDCDGSDAAIFKVDFGRNAVTRPCTAGDPCNGDFACNGNVDGTDAARFKVDFGRSGFSNPCPSCTTTPWCSY
jgi:hypothetical protein